MDWQQLPAITGNQGFEYKVSIIHLSTRLKYSVIYPEITSAILSTFFKQAVQRLPPFFIVFTDNAMAFTMKFTAHPERKTAFTQTVEGLGIRHALIKKGQPWRNGFIERSNRTDNDELFHRMHFSSSEERSYYLRLWEMYYNHERPHQGLANQTPCQVYQTNYRLHASTRMIS